MKCWLGIDCGSVSLKGVVIDEAGEIVASYYTKNHGLNTIKEVLGGLVVEHEVAGVGITGSGREIIATLIGGDVIESEVIAHYVAATVIRPDVSTIFDIGGEDCKLMVCSDGNLITFQMNRDCGGGTGAMIEAIAYRLGISLDDIGDTALKSQLKVSIPSKCGVFAQSAVVSRINKGVPREDILMGVCRGLIGNYFTMLAKGIRLRPPYMFQGATAKNRALVKCFEEEVGEEVIVPEKPEFMGALGVALLTRDDFRGQTAFRGFRSANSEFTTKTYYGKGCINRCEITRLKENGILVGYIGNRCDNCVPSRLRKQVDRRPSTVVSATPLG